MSEKTVKIGQRVEVPSKESKGTVAFVGSTNFSSGKWIGVILDEPKGKNNGTVQGKSYFKCEDGFGTFLRQTQISVLDGDDEDASSDLNRSGASSTGTTPVSEKPKSSIKRKVEPTSLRRKPIGSQVPQKPDRLRLPTFRKMSFGLGSSKISPNSPSLDMSMPAFPNIFLAGSPSTPEASFTPQTSLTKTPSEASLTRTPSQSSLTTNSSQASPINTPQSSLTKTSSQASLTRTPSQTSLTKTATQTNITKATSQTSLGKATSQTNLAKATSQTSLAKGPSGTSFTKATSQITLTKTPQTSLTKTASETSLSKPPSRLNLTKSSEVKLSKSALRQARTPQSSLQKTSFSPAFSTAPSKIGSTGNSFPSILSRKPYDLNNPRFGSTKKSFVQPKLPLGSVGKLGSPQKATQDEKSPGKDSPRQEMKKAPSFVEGLVAGVGASPDKGTAGLSKGGVAPPEAPSQTNFVETLTPQFTPGPASAAMQTLEDKANALQALQEIENLKAEITDLNEKLETLRIKRAQDKDKLKEGEKLKIQVEQLVEFKSRIMESQASLQKELQKAREEAKEAVEARDRHVEETEELTESVELLTLDKEMAEEKAETLQLELEQAREKIEELTLDLEILKAESAEGEDGVLKIDGKSSSVQVKQLDQQNARLRETLVRMRDISAHDKHELQKLQKELEVKKTELAETTREKEKLESLVTEMKATISDLQEQVDAALGAEEMCETLTDRNLNLEERVAELQEEVADLEAINDMNDQLMESGRENELYLREELDMANAKIAELNKEKEALNEVIVDRDTTIRKFRDLVQKLHEQNLELRHDLEKETNKPMGTPSEIIDFKKMFSEAKAHSKAIDLELRQLEVQQANQHVRYLTQYLPDTFMSRGGDHDAVLVLLLLSRMVWKTEIVIGGLRDKYSFPEDEITRQSVLQSHAVDQYSFSSRMLQMLYMLQAMLKQYEHVLKSCSVELFLKMGTLYPEMAAHERNLDIYIELMRKDQLDETVVLDHLEKAVGYFLMVYPTHLGGEKLDQSSYLNDVAKVIRSASQAVLIEAKRVKVFLPPSESESSEMASLLKCLESVCQEIDGSVKKIRRHMPQDGSTGPLSYPERIQEALSNAMSNLYNSSRALRQVSKVCMQQTALIGESEGGISNDKLKEFFHQATDLFYGSEDQGPDSIKNSVQQTDQALQAIALSMQNGEYDFDGTSGKEPIPPISLRAESIKNELKDTEHLKYKLETKEQDMKELKVALKQKNEELSEMTVRRDMTEKKLSTATRDADITIEKLQRKLDDTLMMLRRKEKEYEETMDQLQTDIESLELEKGELREKLKLHNKKTLYEAIGRTQMTSGSPSSPTPPNTSSSLNTSQSGVMVTDSPMLLQQISNLKKALQCATSINHYNTAADMQKKLASLKPLKFPRSSLLTKSGEKRDLDKEERMETKAAEESAQRLADLTKQVVDLRKELNWLLVNVEVVDISKRKPGVVPATQSLSPMSYLIDHNLKVATLKKRIAALQDEIGKLVVERNPAGSISSSFTTFPTPQLVKTFGEKELIKIGRVTVHGDSSSEHKTIPVILQPQDLRVLHMKLLY